MQCTLTRKRSLIPASYFTDLEKKEHRCLKKSTVFILHFAPSLHFTLSLQSAFYTHSAFYPWSAVCSLQSAVCSPQSAFYTDRHGNYIITTEKPTTITTLTLRAIPKPDSDKIHLIHNCSRPQHNKSCSFIIHWHATILFPCDSWQGSIAYQKKPISRKDWPQKYLSAHAYLSVKLH